MALDIEKLKQRLDELEIYLYIEELPYKVSIEKWFATATYTIDEPIVHFAAGKTKEEAVLKVMCELPKEFREWI